jgi:hypothetical protein
MRCARLAGFMLAVAAACGGCSREIPEDYRASWKRVELPGFSLSLPDGKLVSTSSLPSQGNHKLKLEGSMLEHWRHDIVRNGAASVSWSSQTMTLEEWNRDYLPLITGAHSSSVPGVKLMQQELLDEDRWLSIVGAERVLLGIGVVRCDESFQVEITYTRYHDSPRQMADLRELVSSVRCQVTDNNRTRPEASTRLPENFGRVDGEDLQLFRSLDGEELALNFTQGDIQRDEKLYLSIIKPLLVQSFETEAAKLQTRMVTIPRTDRAETVSLLHATVPESNPIYVGTVYCKSLGLSVMSIWTAPRATDALALERLAQVGCPGGPSTPSPSFDSLVDAACRSGDQDACGPPAGSVQ